MDIIHVGSVFQIDMRNLNISAKSTKDGMIYFGKFEMTRDDFERLSDVDLTGSCFVAQLECTALGNKKPKGGSLAESAGLICREPRYHAFLQSVYQKEWLKCTKDSTDDEVAAIVMRDVCGMESRAELDHNKEAVEKFKRHMAEYRMWEWSNQNSVLP